MQKQNVMQLPNPNDDFAVYKQMQARIMKNWAGLQMLKNIKGSTSLGWLEQ